ncbi:MAG TPA: acetyl-CoA carboxylase biotin carboxyl carrier protein subunit [Candidatus Kryptonia bacterium]
MPGILIGDEIIRFLSENGTVVINSKVTGYQIVADRDGKMIIKLGDSIREVLYSTEAGTTEFYLQGTRSSFRALTDRALLLRTLRPAEADAGLSADLKAPMPGMVVRVSVREGEKVARGTPMVILEAMKMENEIRAPRDAFVESVAVREGMAVEKDQVLLKLR